MLESGKLGYITDTENGADLSFSPGLPSVFSFSFVLGHFRTAVLFYKQTSLFCKMGSFFRLFLCVTVNSEESVQHTLSPKGPQHTVYACTAC